MRAVPDKLGDGPPTEVVNVAAEPEPIWYITPNVVGPVPLAVPVIDMFVTKTSVLELLVMVK